MDNKRKIAGVLNILCAVLFTLSYIICTYFLEIKYDLEGRYIALLLFFLLVIISYVAIPFLFIGLVPLAIIPDTPFAPCAPWLISASMFITGIGQLLKRKQGFGTKILLAVNVGFKGNGNVLIGFYGLLILFSLSSEVLWAGVLTWITVVLIFVSTVLDCIWIGKKRKKNCEEKRFVNEEMEVF